MKPLIVNDVELAFGGNMTKLLPSMDKIPKEFIRDNNKWNKVISDMYYYGIKECQWEPKEGIVVTEALRHINAILVSFQPKHEHKMAGCAYLLSEFFEDVRYVKASASNK